MSAGRAEVPRPPAAEALGARYEELRRWIVDGSGWSSRLGLAVLLREGLAAWIAACAMVSVPGLAAATPPSDAACRLPDDRHAELVHVLAGMALPWLDRRIGP